MTRYRWIALAFTATLCAFFLLGPGIVERSMNKVTGPQPPAVSPRAAALHRTLDIADMHADTLLWSRNFLDRADRGQVDLPRLEDGNVALQVLSSVTKTPRHMNYDHNSSDTDNITALTIMQRQPPATWGSLLERSFWHAAKAQRAEAASGGKLAIIRTRMELMTLIAARHKGTKATGILLSVEGLHDLEGKFDNLDLLYRAGFRMAGLTHFFDNELAGSMHGISKGGLTPFGVRVVKAMEQKGMIVDIAHCSHKCVADVLAIATKPVVSSHGGVQAVCNVNRNLTDDEVRGVARTGGIVGIGYWEAAVCDTSAASIARSIKHVRDLVGIDHVGLGSDFDGAVATRFDTTRLDAITQALIDAGFSDEDIGKVMGGNVIRLLEEHLPTEI